MERLYEKLDVDFKYEDGRGSLSQLVHGGFSQINVLETKAGVSRGGHYHKICREAFFIVAGSVKVMLKKNGIKQMEIFHKGDFFLIAPFIVHSMYFPEDCIMVALYDVPVETADTVRDIYPDGI